VAIRLAAGIAGAGGEAQSHAEDRPADLAILLRKVIISNHFMVARVIRGASRCGDSSEMAALCSPPADELRRCSGEMML
jgi:hypothetical protein